MGFTLLTTYSTTGWLLAAVGHKLSDPQKLSLLSTDLGSGEMQGMAWSQPADEDTDHRPTSSVSST